MNAIDAMRAAALPLRGVLHIGANEGQERFVYAASGAVTFIYVEPIAAVFARLEANLADLAGHRAVKAVCSDRAGETVDFKIASNDGLSSSLFELGQHAEVFPSVVYVGSERMTTTTVDALMADLAPPTSPNLLVVDTQGADLKVLHGASETLKQIDGVFVEVSETPLYIGGCTFADIRAYLEPRGFHLRQLRTDAVGHGDAFFARSSPAILADLPTYGGDLARGKNAYQSSFSMWSRLNDPQGAVRGVKSGSFGFHTDEEDRPWWQVDLGSVTPLSEIRVFNRIDGCGERADSLHVFVSDDGMDWREVHSPTGQTFGGVDGRPLRVMVPGERARIVRMQLGARNYLHLDAVEVY